MAQAIAVSGPKYGSRLSLRSRTNLFPVNKLPRFPLTSSFATINDLESNRTFKKLPPSEMTHQFHSVPIDSSEMDVLRREIDALKPKVKNMLMSSQAVDSMKKRILLIYLLVSLGLGYHFEDDIEEILNQSFENINDMMAGEDDLYTVSTVFRVFRTYGHNISSDVFNRFKMSNGKFMESLVGDTKGIMSLYEAAQMRTRTDYILEDALRFASYHLESIAADRKCPSHISRRIQSTLGLSQHWNMEILVAVEYISFYEQEEDHDQLLLKFAKMNFNLIQLHYLQELKTLTKWDPNDVNMEKQPEYLKFVFKFILDVFDEFEREMRSEGRPYSIKVTKEEFNRLARANIDLLKWEQEAHIPSFEEYMKVGEVEAGVYLSMPAILMGMGHMANEEAYEWLKSRPQAIESLCTKTRLLNDITGFEDAKSRGCVLNVVNCYMKQYGTTENEAIRKLREMDAYNDIILNEELLKNTHVPRQVLKVVINFARILRVLCNEGEGYTLLEGKIKEYMTSLFVNRFIL